MAGAGPRYSCGFCRCLCAVRGRPPAALQAVAESTELSLRSPRGSPPVTSHQPVSLRLHSIRHHSPGLATPPVNPAQLYLPRPHAASCSGAFYGRWCHRSCWRLGSPPQQPLPRPPGGSPGHKEMRPVRQDVPFMNPCRLGLIPHTLHVCGTLLVLHTLHNCTDCSTDELSQPLSWQRGPAGSPAAPGPSKGPLL